MMLQKAFQVHHSFRPDDYSSLELSKNQVYNTTDLQLSLKKIISTNSSATPCIPKVSPHYCKMNHHVKKEQVPQLTSSLQYNHTASLNHPSLMY